MNEGAIQTLLDHLFPHGVPASLRPLIHPARAGTLLNEFKLGPILPLGADRAPRLAISDEGEPTQWEHHLKRQWPHPRLSRFLGQCVCPSFWDKRFVPFSKIATMLLPWFTIRFPLRFLN